MTSIEKSGTAALVSNVQRATQLTSQQDQIDTQASSLETVLTKLETNPDIEAQATKNATSKQEDELYSVFPKSQRFFIVFMTVLGAIISPISGAIYLPALTTLADYYQVTPTQINLTITTYLIFQGLSPMFVGSFADDAGHRPAFIVCNIVYVVANIALASQDSYIALVLLRMLQSAGSSGTIALRNAVVASILTPAERGSYLGYINGCMLFAPALGPVIGGGVIATLGWRAIFWGLAIITSAQTIVYAMFVPETNRKIVGNGSIAPRTWWSKSIWQLLRGSKKSSYATSDKILPARKMNWPNPIKSLLVYREPDIAILMLFSSIRFSGIYVLMASLPFLMTTKYHLSVVQVSLCYIPLGGGAVFGSLLAGKMLNYNWKRVAVAEGLSYDKRKDQDLRHFPIERARLRGTNVFILLSGLFLCGFGWSIDRHTPLAVPLVIACFGGAALIGSQAGQMALQVDSFPEAAATVTAASNISRCLVAAAGTAVIQPMIERMGIGWCFTCVGLIMASMAPGTYISMKWGPVWRERRAVREEEKARRKLERLEGAAGDEGVKQ